MTLPKKDVYHAPPVYTPNAKEEFRKKIAKDTEAFLANGGVIQQIPIGVSAHEGHKRRMLGVKFKEELTTTTPPKSVVLGD